jgi:hypothetical protein
VQLIRFFIDLLSFPPVTGAIDSDDALSKSKSDGYDSITNLPDAVMPFFCVTVPGVSQDDALRIQKGVLGETEGHVVLSLVFNVFAVIPVKPGTLHGLEGNILEVG